VLWVWQQHRATPAAALQVKYCQINIAGNGMYNAFVITWSAVLLPLLAAEAGCLVRAERQSHPAVAVACRRTDNTLLPDFHNADL
jgi:hypothetical protein